MNFEHLMLPVWNTDTVYYESFTMIEENGECRAPLMYKPEKIISVHNAMLTETYEEGKDWILDGGDICLTENSRIFRFRSEEFYPDTPQNNFFPRTGGGYIYFGEGYSLHQRQTAVTYTCKKGQWNGYVPEFKGTLLPKTMEKLENKKPLSTVLYGDSISEGWNTSGKTVCEPYLPTWGSLFTENLHRNYGGSVLFRNPSLGGKDTLWGIENARGLVYPYNPDLVIIAFGMNDGIHLPPEQFAENTKRIMDIIREHNSEAEFILVATGLPNRKTLTYEHDPFYNYQYEYKEALDKLETTGAAVADMRDMHLALLERKRFVDLTGNNVNHPNDFFTRCYAQLLSAMLIKQEKI